MRIGQILAALTITGVVAIGGFAVVRNIPGFNGGMSASQIDAMERQLSNAFITGIRQARQNVSVNPSLQTVKVNMSVDSTTNCTSGGSIHTLGGWSGTGSQSIVTFSFQATQTIQDWSCIAGWVVNGDPYIGYTGTVTGTGGSQSVNISQSLGWKASKSGEKIIKQSCQTSGDISYASNGLGHANFHMTCKPGGALNYAMTL